jgi:hypothetical protein
MCLVEVLKEIQEDKEYENVKRIEKTKSLA